MKHLLLTILAFSLAFTLLAQENGPAEAPAAPAKEAEEQTASKGLSGKVTISADRMEMILKKIAKLDGNVEVVFYPSGETLQSLKKQFKGDDIRVILNADHMTVFFPEAGADKENTSSRPEKILATGRIKLHTPDGKSATGDQAAWDLTNGSTIALEGKCTILADGRIMNSSRVVYDFNESRFSAARAIITLPVASRSDSEILPGVKAESGNAPKENQQK